MDAAQCAHDVGLEPEVHGQVGIIPLAQHAEADEVGLLPFDLGRRIFPAQLAEFGGRNLLAVLLFHLQLDRQPVAVPARHVGRIEAGQGLALDDDVLEHLVDRMADMDVTVGIGRTIVQDELGPSGADLAYLLVELAFLPLFQPARFALGEVAAHRKGSVGQVQGVFVISHFFHQRISSRLPHPLRSAQSAPRCWGTSFRRAA